MAELARVGDLEINQDLEFQRRQWAVQRVAWLVLLALAVATLVGLFGGGPLSTATADDGPLRLRYARFARTHAPTELTLSVDGAATRSGQVEIWLASAYLDGLEITAISPEPERSEVAADRGIVAFQVVEAGQPVWPALWPLGTTWWGYRRPGR